MHAMRFMIQYYAVNEEREGWSREWTEGKNIERVDCAKIAE